MRYKMVAIDMDGTTLDERKRVSEGVMEAIGKAMELGVMVVPATGRTLGGIPGELLEAGMPYAVTGNGASIIETRTGKHIYENEIENGCAVELVTELKKIKGITYVQYKGQYYQDKEYLEEGSRCHPLADLPEAGIVDDLAFFLRMKQEKVQKVGILLCDEAGEKAALELQAEFPELKGLITGPLSVEYNEKTASKGEALKQLCAYLGWKREDVMAIGDSDNDITMIEYAGMGVAMGNATENVMRVADFVTKTNEEQGVAWAIEELLLK